MDRLGTAPIVTRLATIAVECGLPEEQRRRVEIMFTLALREARICEYRCNLCGGVVRFDGVKPSVDR